MLKFRIEGTKDELADALDALDDVFFINSTSKLYPNREDDSYRVYVEAEPKPLPDLYDLEFFRNNNDGRL